jgi:nucleoside-diphosphate-sugar epimerase
VIPLRFVFTRDVAGCVADAVDVQGVDGQGIDIDWDGPVSIREIAAAISRRPLGLLNT